MEPQGFDAAYLDRLRAGDPETERHFVEQFRGLVLVKAKVRLRFAPVAEDVCQETLLRVLRAVRQVGSIHSPERLGGFVNAVCNNVLLECIRNRRRHRPADGDPADTAASGASPEDSVLAEERKSRVRQVIAGLSPRDQSVLRAVFLEERDKDEVCASLGVGRDYLRVLLHRAKNEFRARYLDARTGIVPAPGRSTQRVAG